MSIPDDAERMTAGYNAAQLAVMVSMQQQLLDARERAATAEIRAAKLERALRGIESLLIVAVDNGGIMYRDHVVEAPMYRCSRCGARTELTSGLLLHARWCLFAVLEEL